MLRIEMQSLRDKVNKVMKIRSKLNYRGRPFLKRRTALQSCLLAVISLIKCDSGSARFACKSRFRYFYQKTWNEYDFRISSRDQIMSTGSRFSG